MNIPRQCAECGTPFTPHDYRVLTCSTACSRTRKNRSSDRTRHKAKVRRTVSRYTDITAAREAEMYRRTRKCRLCGVFMTGKPGRPNSKNLDHIIPVCMGGTHTHGNVRIICRLCNLRRPKDGSDYTGPVTLWAQVPGVAARTRPKAGAKPRPASRPPRMAACPDCHAQFAQRSHRQARCPDCMAVLARQAIQLRRDGVPWKEIAPAIGYTIAGAHLLAQRHGLYASV